MTLSFSSKSSEARNRETLLAPYNEKKNNKFFGTRRSFLRVSVYLGFHTKLKGPISLDKNYVRVLSLLIVH